MIFGPNEALYALLELEKLKGKERAKLIERILRWETAHFKSTQYKLTGSAGMELGQWSDLDESKFATVKMKDNHPHLVKEDIRTFIVWPSVLDFCLYLSDYIDRHDGDFARWNSTKEAKQIIYAQKVNSVKNRFIK